jgi:hypothetical protein
LREGFCCTPRLIFPIRRDSGINQKEIKLEIILPDGNEARLSKSGAKTKLLKTLNMAIHHTSAHTT